MTTAIDFATAADLDALADLLAELFTLESDFVAERDKQLRGLRLILDNPALGRLFALRVDGRVAGMANALITVSTAEGRAARPRTRPPAGRARARLGRRRRHGARHAAR